MSDRCSHDEAVRRSQVIDRLAAFDPRIVGTLPLGIAMPGSDIDVICHAVDGGTFAEALWCQFGEADGFALWQWIGSGRPVVWPSNSRRFSSTKYGSERSTRSSGIQTPPGPRRISTRLRSDPEKTLTSTSVAPASDADTASGANTFS